MGQPLSRVPVFSEKLGRALEGSLKAKEGRKEGRGATNKVFV